MRPANDATGAGMSDVEPLWTANEVAGYCRVSVSMVYKLSQSGELPCLKIGACLRFDPATVRRFAHGEIRGMPEGRVVELHARRAG